MPESYKRCSEMTEEEKNLAGLDIEFPPPPPRRERRYTGTRGLNLNYPAFRRGKHGMVMCMGARQRIIARHCLGMDPLPHTEGMAAHFLASPPPPPQEPLASRALVLLGVVYQVNPAAWLTVQEIAKFLGIRPFPLNAALPRLLQAGRVDKDERGRWRLSVPAPMST